MRERSSVPPFDTQGAVDELVAAGMQPEQARVVVRLHGRWADYDFATGKDIDRLHAEIEHLRESIDLQLNAQRSALETTITQSSANTIRWVTGSQIGTAAVYLAALLAAIKF